MYPALGIFALLCPSVSSYVFPSPLIFTLLHPSFLQRETHALPIPSQAVEERLRAVEAGVGALLRAAQNPAAADPDYYAQN